RERRRGGAGGGVRSRVCFGGRARIGGFFRSAGIRAGREVSVDDELTHAPPIDTAAVSNPKRPPLSCPDATNARRLSHRSFVFPPAIR
ncbi:hypothetical protein, partial [Burkholderia oklahomensis]|uniref:hypothetical protein n=1 Tax=Burkholderia oklahomensis TaxID=342113 RepID=UPI0012FDF7F0